MKKMNLDQLGLQAIIQTVQNAECIVILDIDETLLNPIPHWTDWLNQRMNTNLTAEDIERAGGIVNVFKDTELYSKALEHVITLRYHQVINANLSYIDGALTGIQTLQQMKQLQIGGYLTTRPEAILQVTKQDLMRKGFPNLPVLIRPEDIARESTVDWKLANLDTINRECAGTVIMIDDNLPLGYALQRKNQNSSKPIVSIVFNGPLTYSTVERENIKSQIRNHFYIATWAEIPEICRKYLT